MNNINTVGAIWSWIICVVGLPIIITLIGSYFDSTSSRVGVGVFALAVVVLLHWQKKNWSAQQKATLNTFSLGLAISVLCWIAAIGASIGFVALMFAIGEPGLD